LRESRSKNSEARSQNSPCKYVQQQLVAACRKGLKNATRYKFDFIAVKSVPGTIFSIQHDKSQLFLTLDLQHNPASGLQVAEKTSVVGSCPLDRPLPLA
jgi:hypothetical protein